MKHILHSRTHQVVPDEFDSYEAAENVAKALQKAHGPTSVIFICPLASYVASTVEQAVYENIPDEEKKQVLPFRRKR